MSPSDFVTELLRMPDPIQELFKSTSIQKLMDESRKVGEHVIYLHYLPSYRTSWCYGVITEVVIKQKIEAHTLSLVSVPEPEHTLAYKVLSFDDKGQAHESDVCCDAICFPVVTGLKEDRYNHLRDPDTAQFIIRFQQFMMMGHSGWGYEDE